MKQLILIAFILLFNFSLTAQNDNIPFDRKAISKNVIYLELGGSGFSTGGEYSLNYERALIIRPKMALAIRAGLFYRHGVVVDHYSVPILLTFITKPMSKSHLEMGIGFVTNNFFDINKKVGKLVDEKYGITSNFKYRFQNPSGHFYFSVGGTPTFYLRNIYYGDYALAGILSPSICIGGHF